LTTGGAIELWAVGTLKNLGTVERGRSRHRPRNDPSLYGGNYPFFQTGDVKAASLRLSSYGQTYNEMGLAQSRLWPTGTLLITIAANIGDTAILDISGCFPDSIVGFTPFPEKSNVIFVKYLLDHIKRRFENISRGTTQDNLSLEKLLSVPLTYPELSTQRKIAAILSAYDDLIENNNRRIKLLEEMAQRIYREWFVDFRYPGREAEPLVDSESGRIPEGWCFRPLSTLAKVVMGQSPPSSAYNKNREGKPFHQGVGTFGTHFPAHDVYSKTGTRLAEKDDILMSVRAPVGRINVADREMILGRGLSGIRAEAGPFEFLLFALRHFFREEDVMGNGSIFKSVTKRDVENLPLPWPGHYTAQRFSDLVSPLWRHLQLLTRERLNLESTRDLLLPRLVSGDVDVTNFNIDITETAA
jgi:type I restriction enzyme S subunit